ncbi:RICIN domain-containing protein [Streptomyces sp. NPDC059994]|uniref:RICIN domain-containing protein n=1 Tax=Streptomyces sp. NPDC059994 TaxID=3347029 RepID=UPI0036CDDA7D
MLRYTAGGWSDVQLVNSDSGLFLAARGTGTAAQADCDHNRGTRWEDQHGALLFDPNGNSHFMLYNRNSKDAVRCLGQDGFP